MKKIMQVFLSLSLFAGMSLVGTPLSAQTVNIKIASSAPENTPWGDALSKIAREWESASNGLVKVSIFAGGVAGEEAQVIKKMKLGQFQGVALTTMGLIQYDKSVMDFSAPGVFRDTSEVVYVVDKKKSQVQENMRKKGVELVFMGMAGWTYVFSTLDVTNPEVAKKSKFAVSPSAPEINTILKNMNYNIVVVSSSDTLVSLNSGKAQTYISSPIYVAIQQLFGISKYMLDVPIAPFLGGLVIDSKTWAKIPADLQPKLAQIAAGASIDIQTQAIALENDAVKTMQKYGLVYLQTTEQQKEAWRSEFKKGMDSPLVKDAFNTDMLKEVYLLLDDYRKNK